MDIFAKEELTLLWHLRREVGCAQLKIQARESVTVERPAPRPRGSAQRHFITSPSPACWLGGSWAGGACLPFGWPSAVGAAGLLWAFGAHPPAVLRTVPVQWEARAHGVQTSPVSREGSGGQEALCHVLPPHLVTEARAEALLPMLQARKHQPKNVQSHLGEHPRTVVVHSHKARQSPDVLSCEERWLRAARCGVWDLEPSRAERFVSVVCPLLCAM